MACKVSRFKKGICECCGISDPRILIEHYVVPRSEGSKNNPAKTMTVCANYLIIHDEDKLHTRVDPARINAELLFEKLYQAVKQQYGTQQRGGIA